MHIPLLDSILGQLIQHILFKRLLHKIVLWKLLVGGRLDVQCIFLSCQVSYQPQYVYVGND